MRYLSLFSGIEAASQAWTPLGWECAAVAEIEPFPCAVLKHRYPDIPNLGDVTKITEETIRALGPIDAVIFGAPCQDLSVAGQRKGLKNADGSLTRSGLFFTACRIAEWSKARWAIWENVPGAFSSQEGRDFACVAGELSGAEISVPGDGWANSGVALGPRGLVEWIVLDAQYIRVESHSRAVPQRRRRVFVIRDSGDWQSRAPLFLEPESLRGNPPPRREAGERVTGTLSARSKKSGGGLGTDFDCDGGRVRHDGIPDIADCLQERDAKGSDSSTKGGHLIPVVSREVAQSLTSSYGRQPDNTDSGEGPNLAVAFTQNQAGDVLSGDVMHSLGTNQNASGRNAPNVQTGIAVRRLTPKECERLQGFPDDFTAIPKAKDGPRYKALGNSMAVNVMRLIGERIERAQNTRND